MPRQWLRLHHHGFHLRGIERARAKWLLLLLLLLSIEFRHVCMVSSCQVVLALDRKLRVLIGECTRAILTRRGHNPEVLVS